MKSKKFAPKKHVAQAMVEFAIVLPILLVLLYGILEAGRLLFMYSSIVTASRQAARYGSATGMGEDWTALGGPNNDDIPRYQDCFGIIRAAKKADFLNAFNPDPAANQIKINYDAGEGIHPGGLHDTCHGGRDTDVNPSDLNTTRIVVEIDARFDALVPLVPLRDREIKAKSARTILVAVSIPVVVAGATTPVVNITHDPNPSPVGMPVPIVVKLTDIAPATGIPTGTVSISVAGIAVPGCQNLTLDGTGTAPACPVPFVVSNTAINVTYTSDDPANWASTSGSATHDVVAATTTVEIIDTPSYTAPGESFYVTIKVTSQYNIPPLGTVTVSNSEGGGCGTLTLSNTPPSTESYAYCTMTFAGATSPTHPTTITADYTGGPTYSGFFQDSTATIPHTVNPNTATPSNTPPPTRTPTATLPPTATLTATSTQPVVKCDNLTWGDLIQGGDTMYMSITNPNTYSLTVRDVYVVWNHDKGHQFGGDKTLKLKTATLAGVLFYSSDPPQTGPSLTITPGTTLELPPGTSNIVFTFHQTYTTWDTPPTEEILINLSSPGCEAYPIRRTRVP